MPSTATVVLEAHHPEEALSPSTPSHNKTGSTIKGGWWREHDQNGEQFGWITASLAAAKEERVSMVQMLEVLQSQGLKRAQNAQSESEEMSWGDALRSMESKMKQFHSKTLQELGRMDRAWTDRVGQIANDRELKERRKSLIWNDDESNGNSKERERRRAEEAKLDALRRQIESLRNEIKSKDAVIASQRIIIEELQAKQSGNHSVQMLKSQIVDKMDAALTAMSALQNGPRNLRGNVLDDVG